MHSVLSLVSSLRITQFTGLYDSVSQTGEGQALQIHLSQALQTSKEDGP
jgi:hypothetical protein